MVTSPPDLITYNKFHPTSFKRKCLKKTQIWFRKNYGIYTGSAVKIIRSFSTCIPQNTQTWIRKGKKRVGGRLAQPSTRNTQTIFDEFLGCLLALDNVGNLFAECRLVNGGGGQPF